MEKIINLNTKDNHIIYGVLNYEEDNNMLVIFVHGLTGNMDEHMFYNAAKLFPKKGFNTYRFNFYDCAHKGRCLTDTTLTSQSKDLNLVISHFKNKYKKIFLVCHSIGPLISLMSNYFEASAIIFWNPGIKVDMGIKFNSKLDNYTVNWGTEHIIPKKLVEEWSSFDLNYFTHIKTPIKLIFSNNEVNQDFWEDKSKNLNVPHNLYIIKDADHCFNPMKAEKELFNETLKWLEKYSK